MAIRNEYKPAKVLVGWREMMQVLPEMNEAELEAALKKESAREDKRKDMIRRLYGRLTSLRRDRELKEYMQ